MATVSAFRPRNVSWHHQQGFDSFLLQEPGSPYSFNETFVVALYFDYVVCPVLRADDEKIME